MTRRTDASNNTVGLITDQTSTTTRTLTVSDLAREHVRQLEQSIQLLEEAKERLRCSECDRLLFFHRWGKFARHRSRSH